MKNLILKNSMVIVLTAFLLLAASVILYASENGITGRTKKTSNNGCGGCHGSTADPQVSVTISGPDSVTTGQTVQYSLTISKASKLGAGLDIAVKTGTLAPVSSNIHLSNGELTHNSNLTMTNGSITVLFNYTAPGSAGTDSLYAIGNATNSNGNTSGDDWNWANGKRIIVRNPNAIKNISGEVPGSYSLKQNYPNPFNPSTNIRFSIPASSEVKLSVFDLTGKEVASLFNGVLAAGNYEADWNASGVSSGVYFYKLSAGNFTETKKMMLTK